MQIVCRSCRSKIALEDINVSTDLALCRACGKSFRYSALAGGSPERVDLASPPPGAWFEPLSDGFRVGATTRSWMAVLLVPFTCAWSGGSISGLYGTQIAQRHFDFSSSLFGLPFLIGTCILAGGCAMTIAGQITITRREERLVIFAGVGVFGWTRKYAVSDFDSIREETGSSKYNRHSRAIVLEGARRVSFGSLWNEDRRYYVLKVIRKMLDPGNRFKSGPLLSA